MIVYQALNNQNGRRYIGCTARHLEVRKSIHFKYARNNHQSPFCHAIRKYGESSFSWSILAEANDEKSMFILEKKFIKDLKPEYNQTEGGDGVSNPSSEIREKIRAKLLGVPKTLEHRRKIGESSKRKKGTYRLSDQTKKKMSEAKRKWWSERK